MYLTHHRPPCKKRRSVELSLHGGLLGAIAADDGGVALLEVELHLDLRHEAAREAAPVAVGNIAAAGGGGAPPPLAEAEARAPGLAAAVEGPLKALQEGRNAQAEVVEFDEAIVARGVLPDLVLVHDQQARSSKRLGGAAPNLAAEGACGAGELVALAVSATPSAADGVAGIAQSKVASKALVVLEVVVEGALADKVVLAAEAGGTAHAGERVSTAGTTDVSFELAILRAVLALELALLAR